MAFQLDTSGRVECPASFQPLGWAIWSDLDPFTQGYVEAAMRSLYEAHHSAGIAARMRVTYLFSDLAPETLARIIADCGRFNESRIAPLVNGAGFWSKRQAGLYRGHETGFPRFPPLALTLGEDGKLRFAEAGQ
jgi:hypothetical protein